MHNEFAVKFREVSEESLGRDEAPRQACHELFFHKYLTILYCIYFLLCCKDLRVLWSVELINQEICSGFTCWHEHLAGSIDQKLQFQSINFVFKRPFLLSIKQSRPGIL